MTLNAIIQQAIRIAIPSRPGQRDIRGGIRHVRVGPVPIRQSEGQVANGNAHIPLDPPLVGAVPGG